MLTKETLERKVSKGYTAMGMADWFDVDVQVIYRSLKKHGLKIRRPYEILDDERSVILNLRSRGMKIKDIAKIYEIEYQCIRSTTVKEWFRRRKSSKTSFYSHIPKGEDTTKVHLCGNRGCCFNKDLYCSATGTECFGYILTAIQQIQII